MNENSNHHKLETLISETLDEARALRDEVKLDTLDGFRLMFIIGRLELILERVRKEEETE